MRNIKKQKTVKKHLENEFLYRADTLSSYGSWNELRIRRTAADTYASKIFFLKIREFSKKLITNPILLIINHIYFVLSIHIFFF